MQELNKLILFLILTTSLITYSKYLQSELMQENKEAAYYIGFSYLR